MKISLMNPHFEGNWLNELLKYRGVDEENLELFYNPTLECLNDPSKLENCESAAKYILDAVKANKKIGILQDCDVDGITSSTIIYHYLKELNNKLEIYTTFHTHKQHGLEDSWERFVENQCELVITPDAGINDKIYHDLLGEKNIFTIVLDHHEYENKGFSEYAIYVDNQISPNYDNKSLAGCGVTWQCCRMMDRLNNNSLAFKYIDLVALGCSADVMSPLTLENRFIFDYGFSHVQDKVFKSIIEKQAYSMKGVVDYTSVAFYVAPLINACMRTGNQEEKEMMYSMFLNPDQQVPSNKRGAKGEIVSITEECLRVLTNVKARQQRMIDNYTDKFTGRINSNGLYENNIIIVHLNDEDNFDSELNGLLAMKFSNIYHKPCLFIRDGLDEETKGSARNPNGSPIIDLKTLISSSPFTTFVAGHANAHGVGIKTNSLDSFIEWFNTETADLNFAENTYQVNYEADINDIQLLNICEDVAMYNKFWGGNNPQPIIALKNLHINTKQFIFMGTKKDTLKLSINGLDCMFFKRPDLYEQWNEVSEDIVLTCIGRPALNEWGGKTTIQLMIDDMEWKKDNILEF